MGVLYFDIRDFFPEAAATVSSRLPLPLPRPPIRLPIGHSPDVVSGLCPQNPPAMFRLSSRYILPLALGLTLTACSDDDSIEDVPTGTELPMPVGNRTVLLYVSAQNSLGHNRFHLSDSLELALGAKYIKDNDRLLVYLDDGKKPRIYRFANRETPAELVKQWNTDLNSSDPKTLEEVLTWTRTNFPSQDYGLVMWSHSDGWLPSTNKNYGRASWAQPYSFGIDVGADGHMGYDEDSEGNIGAQMDIKDMAAAIRHSGILFNFIFFDSCLMQTLESSYDLREATNFVIAGPMQIPGCGANYTHLLQKGLFTHAEKDIVETYYRDAYEGFSDPSSLYYDYGIILASIRAYHLDHLAQVIAEGLPESAAAHRQSVDLEGVQQYQAYCSNYFFRPHHYDAAPVLQRILTPEHWEKVKKVLDNAIVAKAATSSFWMGPYANSMNDVDLDTFSGIAMFVPQQVYTTNAPRCLYGDLNKAFRETDWYKAAGWAQTGW